MRERHGETERCGLRRNGIIMSETRPRGAGRCFSRATWIQCSRFVLTPPRDRCFRPRARLTSSLPITPHELRAVGPHEAPVLAVGVPFRRRRPSPVRRAKGEARVLRVVDERHLPQEGRYRYHLPTARAARTVRARRLRVKGVPQCH